MDGEDLDSFEALLQEVKEEFAPCGPIETFLTERLATLLWRLRRVSDLEAGLFALISHRQTEADAANADPLAVGRMVEALMGKGLLSKLGRYEAQLTRNLEKTRLELQKLLDERAAMERRQEAENIQADMEMCDQQVFDTRRPLSMPHFR
jgi:hypothetical protein